MNIDKEGKSIELLFETNIDYKLYNAFEKIKLICNEDVNQVFLNFSKTKYITLPGCIYVIFLLHEIKISNRYLETKIISITENLIHFLTKFGFFNSSAFYFNLKVEKQIKHLVNKSIHSKSSAIYWPIATVPQNLDRDFDSNNSKFMNDYSEHFDLLIENDVISSETYSIREIRAKFLKAIYELIKNIWEHSESWGLSSIQSTNATNTTIAICDYGVGFVESYKKRNLEYLDNPENNKELIMSQLKPNFSSKSKYKFGHGLSRVKDFVRMLNGTLLLKTDKFRVVYDGKTDEEIIKNDSYFKGAQIFINF